MPYQPYRTIPREYDFKLSRVSSVSPYPLYLSPGYTPFVPPFDPTSLSAPLITWFGKQDSDITYSGGNPVSWVNQGTNGGSATLTDCISATQNGRDAVNFSTTLTSQGEYDQNFSGYPRAAFFAFKLTGDNITASNHDICITNQGATTIPYAFGIYILSINTPTRDWIYGFVSQTSDLYIASTAVSSFDPLNNNAVLGMVNSANTANNLITLNGIPLSLLNNITANNGYIIGNQTAYLNGIPSVNTFILYELLIYDGEVTAGEATQVTNYLKNKWNI